ncbi:PEFG-CTERM sorting domain-containing protein [Candidatus Nitrosopumilus salaria]|uniref:PEFG-CTERM sorting domain-containing protein n=1 Tax=Candidatus Nitrosopumilus salarius TaxID=1170320 RepID=UPI00064FBCE1|nr:PEFG-CTERM sorting domain-containing protein [Candidatus Nitrosopumilus salaria]
MIRIIVTLFFLLIIPASSFAFAEHIFNPDAFAQYLDISQLGSDKVTLTFDGKPYDLYYGYHGSLDAIGTEHLFPTLSTMKINEDRKSLEITMADVPETTDFWVRMPDDVIYAEKENYIVLVDGIDTGYDLMKFPNDHVIGLIITEDTEHVEIIGTYVIPEFGSIAVMILGISILGVVYYSRRSSGLCMSRINDK